MKKLALVLVALTVATPAWAQFGALDRAIDKGMKAKRLIDIKISDAEERQIGEQVSAQLITTFGVYQDADVAKYVSLVGNVMAQSSSRPSLQWEFIVLDTDGVNAFAAPGGLVHVTRGLLGLIKSEAELAGVLGHELTHITGKHTINSIQKGNAVSFTADEVSASGGLGQSLMTRFAQKAYSDLLNNKFDRNDENNADENGVQLANKVGYAPVGLANALTKLMERNKGRQEPNGLFASHPLMQERLTNIVRVIREKKLEASALGAERYAKNITFDAKGIGELDVVDPSLRGLTGGDGKSGEPAKTDEKKDEKKKEEKKGGFGLGRLISGGSQAQNTQTVASAGGRAGWPDRDATGGTNRTKIPVKIERAALDEFRKGIA